MKELPQKLLLLFVFLLPWQTVYLLREIFIDGEKWQYGTIGLYASIVVLIFLYIILAMSSLRMQGSRMFSKDGMNKKHLFFIFLAMWLVLSLLWSQDPLLSAFKSFTLLLALALPFVIQFNVSVYRTAITVFLASVFIHALIGLWQFISQDSFSSVSLGITGYDVYQGGVSVIETESGRWLRAYGGFPHPNIFGGFMAVCALLSLGMWLTHRAEMSGRLYALAMIIFYVALLASFSRSAILGFFLGLLVFTYTSRKDLLKWFAWIPLSVGLIFTSILFFSQYGDLWQTRSAGESRLEQKSSDERVSQIREAWEVIREKHLFGTGIGSYTKVIHDKNPSTPIWQVQPVHNLDLLIVAELGIIGALILTVLIILWIFNFFRQRQRPFSSLHIAVLAALAALIIPVVVDHWLWTSHAGLFLIVLLVGLLKSTDKA